MSLRFLATVVFGAILAITLTTTSARECSVGIDVVDSRAFDVNVGLQGRCVALAACSYTTYSNCPSCGQAYGGAPCSGAKCKGPAGSNCAPDTTSLTRCCSYVTTCCKVTKRCTPIGTPGPCNCLDRGPPGIDSGYLTICYGGPWTVPSPPCAGP